VEIAIALALAGLGALAWRRRRPAKPVRLFDVDAEVALAVAAHESRSREHPLSPVHVLYGLLQTDAVVAAIARVGGDAVTLEDHVLDELATPPTADGALVVAHAVVAARGHRRLASCVDLWYALSVRDGGPKALDEIAAADVLFVLVHGHPRPAIEAPGGLAELVLHNDDYTPQRIVVDILRDVFELDEPRAVAVMEETHHTGRAIVGTMPVSLAKMRIDTAHRHARDRGYPLWIEATY